MTKIKIQYKPLNAQDNKNKIIIATGIDNTLYLNEESSKKTFFDRVRALKNVYYTTQLLTSNSQNIAQISKVNTKRQECHVKMDFTKADTLDQLDIQQVRCVISGKKIGKRTTKMSSLIPKKFATDKKRYYVFTKNGIYQLKSELYKNLLARARAIDAQNHQNDIQKQHKNKSKAKSNHVQHIPQEEPENNEVLEEENINAQNEKAETRSNYNIVSAIKTISTVKKQSSAMDYLATIALIIGLIIFAPSLIFLIYKICHHIQNDSLSLDLIKTKTFIKIIVVLLIGLTITIVSSVYKLKQQDDQQQSPTNTNQKEESDQKSINNDQISEESNEEDELESNQDELDTVFNEQDCDEQEYEYEESCENEDNKKSHYTKLTSDATTKSHKQLQHQL